MCLLFYYLFRSTHDETIRKLDCLMSGYGSLSNGLRDFLETQDRLSSYSNEPQNTNNTNGNNNNKLNNNYQNFQENRQNTQNNQRDGPQS